MNKFKLSCYSIVVSAALTVFSTFSFAEVVVIVNQNNANTLSESDVEKLFLGKTKRYPSGDTAIPINLPEGSANRSFFNNKLIGKSDSQMKSYWSKMVFSGKAVPLTEVDTDKEVVDLVQSNPNAIGYIDSASVTDGVKVVLSLE
ncbi:phosphate ABC transporter substrate-binding protein [Marinomonas sp. THO17]|uniref:phosphate ABC transporter substrate-binding protein n=1 Tax=Marinomonas sp. THO17 TaxID=3149048 RepID=UPI00336C0E55